MKGPRPPEGGRAPRYGAAGAGQTADPQMELFRRIGRAPTASSKVKALIAVIDWSESTLRPRSCSPVDYDRHKYVVGITMFAHFLESVGRRDLFARFQELASALSDLGTPELCVHVLSRHCARVLTAQMCGVLALLSPWLWTLCTERVWSAKKLQK